jgi:predicted aldo/keto reductase-like oxidoreductase
MARITQSALFNALTAEKKASILKTDYSTAEDYCPQKIQIAKILRRAHEDLS